MRKPWPKALFYGIASSLFFSVTYIINNSMAQAGGDWLWSASLRFLIMLPLLLIMNAATGGLKKVWEEVRQAPWRWILWSTVAFGVFYAPLSFASAYGPSWMVAGTFQFTILAGALETPLFRDENGSRRKIPVKLMPAFLMMLIGVFLLQLENVGENTESAFLFAIPVLISAFAYPLGNRKTMEVCEGRLTTIQRVLAMTLCSLPFWLVLAGVALARSGLPPVSQVTQSAVVAVFSGLVATIVFFHATQLVRDMPERLALVESTQCGELLFSLLGGIWLLNDPWPNLIGWAGLILIIGGMVFNSFLTSKK